MANRKPEIKKGAPAYIVSFSALMTILLTFFILMCSMANEQEAGLLAAGTGAFAHNINSFGLPGLLPGHRSVVDLGEGRPQFALPPDALDDPSGTEADLLYRRIISIEPERLPRVLAEYFEQEEQLRIPLRLNFQFGSAELLTGDEEYLKPLMLRLRRMRYHIRIEAHLGEDFIFSETYRDPWHLSAARAGAVARYLHQRGGLSYRRMQPVGYGNSRPLIRSPLNQRVNERVELVIIRD